MEGSGCITATSDVRRSWQAEDAGGGAESAAADSAGGVGTGGLWAGTGGGCVRACGVLLGLFGEAALRPGAASGGGAVIV